jgi:hypothetical protein
MALKRGALERALKVSIASDARALLAEYGSGLPSAPPELEPAGSDRSEELATSVEAEKGDRL